MRGVDRRFALMFLVMLTLAAGNTALQSVLPALGRSLGVADSSVATRECASRASTVSLIMTARNQAC